MLKCEDPTDTSEKVQSEFKKKKRGGGFKKNGAFWLGRQSSTNCMKETQKAFMQKLFQDVMDDHFYVDLLKLQMRNMLVTAFIKNMNAL